MMKELALIFVGVFVLTIVLCFPNARRGAVQQVLVQAGAITDPVREWEHGLKTSRVTATRYSNEHMGFNIGFKYPKNPNDCDRAELNDFMEVHGGSVYQGGGYPGAEMFVVFEGVKDKESANKKLREILPALTQLITDLGDGKEIAPLKPQRPALTMEQWIAEMNAKKDKCDRPGWQGSGTNGYESWTIECRDGVRVYTDTTKESQEYLAKEEAHKRALWTALNTRCLTDAEMKEVLAYGDSLNITPMVSYRAEEKATELRTAMVRQTMLCQRAQGR